MFSQRSALSEYTIAQENVASYQELCKELSKSTSVFLYKPPSLNVTNSQEAKRKQSDPEIGAVQDVKSSTKNKKPALGKNLHMRNKSSESSDLTDIKTLQKHFISSLGNVSALDVKLFKNVKPSQVCASDSSVISDEIIIQACKKREKVDDDVASVIGNLLLLPKMFHLSSKLPPSSCDALCEYVRRHPKISVTSFLAPFLQLCPETKEQHTELFIQLTEHVESASSTQLLHALSSREVVSKADLDIFQHLCKKVDPQAETNHAAVLAFLEKAIKSHHGLVKFGQCLLYIVKHMGKHISDEETLMSVANSHTSGMKKGIQIQLKKILQSK
ncbi:uncharacterized protein [Palaemon carinicauda]|uniref:uncharacterized protein n=1 Tax=Palaemon carinicauda TaxID=392227 RepID=UPI0035B68940